MVRSAAEVGIIINPLERQTPLIYTGVWVYRPMVGGASLAPLDLGTWYARDLVVLLGVGSRVRSGVLSCIPMIGIRSL